MDQLEAQFHSFALAGVRHFPKAEQKAVAPSAPVDIANCQRCELAQTRKKVVVARELIPKKYFLLCDFPEKEEEEGEFFAPEHLVVKLAERLGILSECHFSFALKCVSEKGYGPNSFLQCAQHNLAYELERTQCETILCFGHRALSALAHLEPSLLAVPPIENSSCLQFQFRSKTIKVFFLSGHRDLTKYTSWRQAAWQALAPLR